MIEIYLIKLTTTPYQTENKISISLVDIVQVESVQDGVRRNIYHDYKPFDSIIWCTGFKANLKHLTDLNLETDGRIGSTPQIYRWRAFMVPISNTQ